MADGFSLSGDSHAKISQDSTAGNTGVTFGAVYDGGPASIAVAGTAVSDIVSKAPWYAWAALAVVAVVSLIYFLRR